MPVARLVLLLAAVFAAAVPAPFAAAGDAPAVTGVEVTSEAGADATYALGETIRVTVRFSEAVDVTGAPRLAIDMDPASWGEKRAAYASGSGTAALVFAHRVVEPNYSTRGIAVLGNTLALNGGTIRSALSGAEAALAHAGLPHDAAHKVDWRLSPRATTRRAATPRQVRSAATGPAVTGVEVTSEPGADATYALGETVEVTVTFSEAVDVTGAPGLAIDMDPASWGEKRAAYARGSGTAALVFAHAVAEPNFSPRGIAVLADTLALNGGTIRSASSGAAAALAHTGLPHNAAHKVDWRLSPRAAVRRNATPPDTTPPELVRGEVDGSTMRLTFSEALDPDATGGRFMVDLATEPLSSAFPATGAVTVEGAVVTVELGAGNPRAEAGRLTGNRATYIRPVDGAGGALRDLAGNPVAAPHVMPYGGVETWRGSEEWRYVGVALDNVTAPAPDTTPPELVRGEIDGGTVTLWFSEELDPEAKAGRFHVQVQPAADRMQAFDAAGAVAIDGNRVTVGVGAGKPRARAGLTELNYAHYIAPLDPAARGLRDLAGNPVATPLAFHGGERGTRSVKLDNVTVAGVTEVKVTSDAGADATYALRDVVRVTVTFSEAVAVTGAPRLKLGLGAGDERWATYRRGSGTAALEFAYTVAEGDASSAGVAVLANTLALNGGTIRSAASGRDAALAHTGLPHDAAHKVDGALPDTTPPRLSRTVVDGAKLTLAFSEAIDDAASPANGAFTVKKTPPGGSEETVGLSGSPAVEGARVTLSLAKAVRGADTGVKVSYRKSGSDAGDRLKDEAGNEVAEFSDRPVANSADTTPPELVRGEIDGGTVTLYFSEALDEDSVGGLFRVTLERPCDRSVWFLGCGIAFSATGGVEIDGHKVTVGLGQGNSRAKAGLPINDFWYRSPTGPAARGLRDLAGNEVSDTRIIRLDNLTAPSVTGVAISSDAGDDDTYALGETIRVRLTFNAAVEVTGAPRLKLDFSTETGDEKWAAYASGSGTNVLEFAYTVAEGDESSAGVAVLKDTLALNGGTIRLVGRQVDANLPHAGLGHDPSHKVDTTLPTLSAATVDRSTLTLTFSETLGAAESLSNSAFAVKKTPQGGTEEAVSLSGTPAIDGATVSLTLATAVLSADTGVKVSYTVPDPEVGDKLGDKLTDAAGNEVASFTDQPVTNGTTKPAVTGVQVTSDAGDDATYVLGETVEVTLTFGEEVNATGTPRVQIDFSSGAGDERWADYASGSGTTMLEFAYTVVANDLSTDGVAVLANTLALNGGTIESASVAGESANLAHAKLDHNPAHRVDARLPSLSTVTVDHSTLTLTYDEALDESSVPPANAFTVNRTPQGGVEETVSLSGSPSIGGATVTLTLANAVLETDTDIKVSYRKPTSGAGNRLRDEAGNEAASFSDQAVTTDLTPPWLVRGEVDGGTMILYFSEALDEDSVGGYFRVNLAFKEDSTMRFSPKGEVEISGNTVVVGLGGVRTRKGLGLPGENWVRYIKPLDPTATKLRDLAGNQVRTPEAYYEGYRSTRQVGLDNITGVAPSVTEVEVSSDAGGDATYGAGDVILVRLTFSKVVNVTGTPRVQIDLGSGAGDEHWADYESGSGTKMLEFAWTVAAPNVSTQGVAVLRNTLALNGGTIESALTAGENAKLEHAGLDHDPAHMVNWQATTSTARARSVSGGRPPSVTGVAVSSEAGDDDTYGLGETIRVTLTFSGEVNVSGSPRLKIDMDPADWGEKWAVYESGSGTDALTFAHEVVEPNLSTQGIAVLANTLALNGGMIESATAAGESATLAHTRLGHNAAHKVDWRPALSAADAEAREGADAAVSFEVTLSRAATGTVTVDYATADGTAAAGADYTATSGTLTFAAGETEKTVSVPVLDDSLDEGKETFTLRLSNAQGGWITDGEATGTITNDDPLQTMWLSRFGRTVASHVTDAVSDRLANPLSGAQVTVGGQRVDLAGTEDGKLVGEALTAVARALGASGQPAQGDGFGPVPGQAGSSAWPGTGPGSWSGAGLRDASALGGSAARALSSRELLLGSAFHLASEGGGGRPGLAAWGRVTAGGFDGEAPADAGRVRIDGEVTTGVLGADAEWNRLLAGVAVSVSEGEGTFDQPGVDKGSIESTMTAVSPYARFMVNERLSAWGLLGWGTGDMTIVQAANDDTGQPERVSRADLEMRLAAVGGRGALLEADEAGGIDLGLKADAFWVETEADAVSNEGATTAVASRVRLALEGSRAFRMDGGGTLTPGVELGLRHDGGDAETGTGVEIGGRVSWEDPETGLSVEARARTLVAHEDSDYREWGASGSVRLAPGDRGRGLSFSLSPTWGAAAGGVERLWSARDARGLAPNSEFEAGQRLEGELGYGLGLSGGRFTGTPNVGFGLSDGAREVRLGWRLTPAAQDDLSGFELNLDATRREAASGNEPSEHGVMLRGAIRW